jgi:dihydrofolate reductase
MKASVFVAASLDGFIARENGDIDWLTVYQEEYPHEDYGFQEFIDTVDFLVMGRGTYDVVAAFESWPYGETPVVVLSTRELDRPPHIPPQVERMSCSPAECVERLAQRGARRLYVDGGKTIQAFLRAGLINDLTITRIPIILGSGIPLFGPLAKEVKLRHLATRAYSNGLVRNDYEVV